MNDHPLVVSAIHGLIVDVFLGGGIALPFDRRRRRVGAAEREESVTRDRRVQFIRID